MKLKTIIQKRQFQFGDCIPESEKIYNYFKRKGYNPEMIEGWGEVDIANDLPPSDDFLFYFCPDDYLKVNENIGYNDYPKVIPHTWVEVRGHIIDITKNQFDIYGGIKQYYELERYHFNKKEIIVMSEV